MINKRKQLAAFFSILSNAFLIIIKLVVGSITGSVSIISEAAHSFSDLLASFMAFFSVRKSAEPADDKHQYGHGKFEDFSGLFEGLLIIAASFYIIYEAFIKIKHIEGHTFEPTAGIVVMGLSVLVNIFVSKYLFKIGKEADSIALIADAQHLRTDILTSAGVLVGLVLIKVTGFAIIDPLIAFFVAGLILHTALKLCYEAAENLLDGSLPEDEIKIVCNAVEQYIPQQVLSVQNLRSRKSGNQKLIDLTLTVHETFTIKQGHDLCDLIEEDIEKSIVNSKVTIHLEPCSDSCNICK